MNWRAVELPAGLAPALVIRLHRGGPLPEIDATQCDLCLSVEPDAPAPWVAVADPPAASARVEAAVAVQPVASAVLIRVLRLTEGMSTEAALEVESLSYSALLGGQGFAMWLARRAPRAAGMIRGDPVRYERTGDIVTLTMDDPSGRNAMSAAMRDALVAALDTCLDDPTRPFVILRGSPRIFCSGGALAEFGLARDLAAAHLVRRSQSVTDRVVALGQRMRIELSGAAIGAGIEFAAASSCLVATPGSWFRLPEIAMGLIPGAGGCMSLPRRLGRHRAAWLMLTGRRIGARQALAWGLVDALVPQ